MASLTNPISNINFLSHISWEYRFNLYQQLALKYFISFILNTYKAQEKKMIILNYNSKSLLPEQFNTERGVLLYSGLLVLNFRFVVCVTWWSFVELL